MNTTPRIQPEPFAFGADVRPPPLAQPLTRRLSSASRSATMLRNVERSIARGEAWLGRRTLLDAVDRVPETYRERHVDAYRQVIRSRAWPNEDRSTSLPVFLEEFERAAMAYVRIGFQALDFVAHGDAAELEPMLRRVEGAEALRGQFGKRAPDGLDARLENYERDLLQLLENRLGAGAPDILNLLGTPVEPHITAEAALIEEFAALRTLFPRPPGADELLTVGNGAAERLWTFLRRHARWSLSTLSLYYDHFSGPQLEAQVRFCRGRRQQAMAARSQALAELRATEPRDWFAQVLDRSTALTLLNHVNLSLEPCFSFKGGVGLGQGFVFQRGAEAGLAPTTDLALLGATKWNLFAVREGPAGKAMA